MKNITLLVAFAFLTNFAFAWQPAPGDSLTVWALSGLNLRENPSQKSKVIFALPFGSTVLVEEQDSIRIPFEERICPNPREDPKRYYTLHGAWLKVNSNGTLGYIFDFYLSKASSENVQTVFKMGENYTPQNNLKKYLKEKYGLTSSKNKNQPSEDKKTKIYVYGSNITLKEVRIGLHDAYELEVFFPGWRFNEVYLLTNCFFRLGDDLFYFKKLTATELIASNEGQGLRIIQNESGCYLYFGSYD